MLGYQRVDDRWVLLSGYTGDASGTGLQKNQNSKYFVGIKTIAKYLVRSMQVHNIYI